jgi:hypothetical protein
MYFNTKLDYFVLKMKNVQMTFKSIFQIKLGYKAHFCLYIRL